MDDEVDEVDELPALAGTPLAPYRSNNYTVIRDSASGRDSVAANGRDFDPGITIPNGGWNAPLGDLAISLELVDARDSRQLWGEQYKRKLSDVLVVQAEISREISDCT